MIKLEKKIQQHYVWEHYLTAWCFNEKLLYCYRKDKQNIFPINPDKIAKEREFYKLKDVTPYEKEIIEELFIKKFHNEEVQEINRNWIRMFTKVFEIRQLLSSRGITNEVIDLKCEVIITNLEEEHHTNLELAALPYLKSLRESGQLPSMEEGESLVDFILFLTTQYFRTKKIKMNVLRSASEISSELAQNVEKIWNISSHILATNTAYSIFMKQCKWRILVNKGKIPFITGDQPAINTFADYSTHSIDNNGFELYYPLSPSKALLISQEKSLSDPTSLEMIEVDQVEVTKYNMLILAAAEEQVFSNNSELLDDLKFYFPKNKIK